VEKALYMILGDPQYKAEDEKKSSRVVKKAKSILFKAMAVSQKLKR
jgi:hypothetical protein